jgi:hypothetical protein
MFLNMLPSAEMPGKPFWPATPANDSQNNLAFVA